MFLFNYITIFRRFSLGFFFRNIKNYFWSAAGQLEIRYYLLPNTIVQITIGEIIDLIAHTLWKFYTDTLRPLKRPHTLQICFHPI